MQECPETGTRTPTWRSNVLGRGARPLAFSDALLVLDPAGVVLLAAARSTPSARLLLPAALQAGAGTTLGVLLYVLWLQHPATLVLALPAAFAARSYVRVLATAERAADAGRRVAGLGLAGTREPDEAAQRVLAACGDVCSPRAA